MEGLTRGGAYGRASSHRCRTRVTEALNGHRRLHPRRRSRPSPRAGGGHEPGNSGTLLATADRLAAASLVRRSKPPPWPPAATSARRTPLQVANTADATKTAPPDPAAEGPDPVFWRPPPTPDVLAVRRTP